MSDTIGNSNKRLKIVVGVNTLTSVDQPIYSNHNQLWFHFGRSLPHIDFILNHPRRMSIDNMRNMTAKVAIDAGADYILFIDDDVLVPITALEELLKCEADVAAGWTLIRGYPFKNMFFRWTDETKQNLEDYKDKDFKYDERGDIPCDAVGFSCALLKVESLKKIDTPYFATGPYNTEDIYYCLKLRAKIPDAKIVVHPGVITSHNLGPEYIDPLNKPAYTAYYEKTFPELLPSEGPETKPQKNHDDPIPGVPSYEELLRKKIFDTAPIEHIVR